MASLTNKQVLLIPTMSSTSRGASTPIPNGVCRDYWNRGSCKFRNCRFEHRRRDERGHAQVSTPSTSTVDSSAQRRRESTLNFSRGQADLVAFTAASSNPTPQAMDAGRALKLLDTLCSSRTEQLTLPQARLLIQILGSIASETSNWTSSDRQSALQKLADSGPRRLQELLEWPDITNWRDEAPLALPFQSGYAIVLSLFTSNALLGSALMTRRNLLYSLVHNSYKAVEETILKAMNSMVARSTASDGSNMMAQALSFRQILMTITTLLTEYVQIFKNAPEDHPSLRQMPTRLQGWLDVWSNGFIVDPNDGADGDRQRTVNRLRNEIEKISTILNRGQVQEPAAVSSTTTTSTSDRHHPPTHEQQLSLLENAFIPPGHLRPDGPRHDNDHAEITEILVAPTHKELLSVASSYIPSTVHDAPHHLPARSMDRLLDLQFRLLREELLYPIKSAIGCVFRDLAQPPSAATPLRTIINDKGGRYKEFTPSDTIFFSVYTNVELTGVSVERRGISVGLTFDIPPGKGRTKSDKEREAFWRALTKKRLKMGALIALVWNKREIHLGLITSNTDDLVQSTKKAGSRPQISVAFFDKTIERRAYEGLTKAPTGRKASTANVLSQHLFIEISLLFEAYKPFLEALKTEPTSLPFSRYLVQYPDGGLAGVKVESPVYTTQNGFGWNLSTMFDPPRRVSLRVQDPESVALASYALKGGAGTRLDPSQADALVSCLTSEVALIQGPPGTGKSYTAIQLLRVLIANNVRPILMVAFTNHALDHLLESIIAAGITKRIIRLGGRSQSEVLQEYTLDKVEKFHSEFLRRGTGAAYGSMKRAEEELKKVLEKDEKTELEDLVELDTYLLTTYPAHYGSLISPPPRATQQLGTEFPEFQQIYKFWLNGSDQSWNSRQPNRNVTALLSDSNVWKMKLQERKSLSQRWKQLASEEEDGLNLATYENLAKNYVEAKQTWEELQSQQRLEALKSADIVGCTTTGAARLLDLLRNLGPKVVLVEEAGQVLEAHSLATLVPSVEHLIMIGDPQQLRPMINNYAFSTDNHRGGHLFKFDRSLMERLDAAGLPMAQLNIQRRMRPEVSTLIRGCLYPNLQDHESVTKYPSVRGMAKNVWFLHHTNKEGGEGEDSVSKCNLFEVEMIKSLVLFFIRQGVYNNPSSIVILCTYLGQLTKIREALASCKLSVVLDERDEKLLADADVQDESAPSTKEVDVSKQIRIRTVDNFQGEEADIVLLSTVRNPGANQTKGIGFLKSSNRTNVALSRARHGMFILGNGEALESGSGTWSSVIQELRRSESYGPAIPFACHRHPEDVKWISEPSEIDVLFPDGRCLLPCSTKLPCGHSCLSKCHPDDGAHLNTRCNQPCGKLCPMGHPCTLFCWEDCKCDFTVPVVVLNCGHSARDIPCAQARQKHRIPCSTIVQKRLTNCEHTVTVPCHEDVRNRSCDAICSKEMDCCSRKCASRCADCQLLHPRRKKHKAHPCDKTLHCQHRCIGICTAEHKCVCTHPCRRSCNHSVCHKGCEAPCSPCAEACTWKCDHQSCTAPCGSPCIRLPCDLRCTRTLSCGHACPSLCGEPCESQICPLCATEDQKAQAVDLVMLTTMEDIDPADPGLDNILITLPCKHAFTVETLDGITGLKDYYERNEDKWIRPTLPPPGTVVSPTCPSCKGEFVSPRYGRVLKSCNLDLLERTTATSSSGRVHQLLMQVDALDPLRLENQLLAELPPISSSEPNPAKTLDISATYRDKLENRSQTPFNSLDFFGQALTGSYGLQPGHAAQWNLVLSRVRLHYQELYLIATQRSAHTKAYEATLTKLYRMEEALLQPSPNLSANDKRRLALQTARIKIGMAPPRSDTRFTIESIWLSVDLRLIMGKLANALQLHIAKEERNSQNIFTRMWGLFNTQSQAPKYSKTVSDFVAFIYKSCEIDAKLARELAVKSEAHKQVLISELKVLRVELEQFNSRVRSLEGEPAETVVERRSTLAEEAKQYQNKVHITIEQVTATYYKAKRSRSPEEEAWVQENFSTTATQILGSWKDAHGTLARGTFYQPVSVEEKRQIQQAFGFTHRGHWYICPNGHTFVIGECGGAMQVGRCNECGAEIGGSQHRILGTNSRNREFEAIAQEQGAQQSPWQWGNDA